MAGRAPQHRTCCARPTATDCPRRPSTSKRPTQWPQGKSRSLYVAKEPEVGRLGNCTEVVDHVLHLTAVVRPSLARMSVRSPEQPPGGPAPPRSAPTRTALVAARTWTRHCQSRLEAGGGCGGAIRPRGMSIFSGPKPSAWLQELCGYWR